jgi:AcrR family transcriptional regulator
MTLVPATVPTPPTALFPATVEFSDAKRRVFEAAILLFGDRGYHAVSVRDIAAQLGLQPMALYAHAPSKQQLLFEIMKIGYATHRERLSAALLDAGRDPAEQIRALCRAHVAAHLEYPALARVTNRDLGALSDEQMEFVERLRAEAAKPFLDVVARGQRLGAFGDDNPTLIVLAVASMGIRAAERWSPDLGLTPEAVADTFAEFAVRIVTCRSSSYEAKA